MGRKGGWVSPEVFQPADLIILFANIGDVQIAVPVEVGGVDAFGIVQVGRGQRGLVGYYFAKGGRAKTIIEIEGDLVVVFRGGDHIDIAIAIHVTAVHRDGAKRQIADRTWVKDKWGHATALIPGNAV